MPHCWTCQFLMTRPTRRTADNVPHACSAVQCKLLTRRARTVTVVYSDNYVIVNSTNDFHYGLNLFNRKCGPQAVSTRSLDVAHTRTACSTINNSVTASVTRQLSHQCCGALYTLASQCVPGRKGDRLDTWIQNIWRSARN